MKYTITARGKFQVLFLYGEVDMHSSATARHIILDMVKNGSHVIIDLSGVKYMDSSGVASLVEGFQHARKLGQEFVLSAPAGSVLGVIKLARLDKVFRIVACLEECDDLVN